VRREGSSVIASDHGVFDSDHGVFDDEQFRQREWPRVELQLQNVIGLAMG
jgi:hypothetical protein